MTPHTSNRRSFLPIRLPRQGCINTVGLILLIATSAVYAQPKIQKGDYLGITVIGYPSFNRQVRVEDNGTILYPYFQDVPVIGLSPVELQTALLQLLQKYLENPAVLVEILEYYTVKVQVLGQVRTPGVIEVPVDLDVQSAISLAGGATPLADLSEVKVLRPAGNASRAWEELQADVSMFMLTGDLSKLPRLKEGDIVVVPGVGTDAYVLVLGEVVKPGEYIPLPQSTLLQSILMAGGATDNANLKKVKLIHRIAPGTSESFEINLKRLIDSEEFDRIPLVAGGDVVVVPGKNTVLSLDNMRDLVRDIYVLVALYVIYIRLD